jgi:glycosyltransferase involved in cell wall biosynthesis
MDIHQLYGGSRRIMIVGTYPPPLGGISVFIYRLELLLRKNNYEVFVFNTALKYRFVGIKFLVFVATVLTGKFEVIHIQNFDLKKIIALLLLRPLKKYKILFTDHNPFLFDNRGFFATRITRLLMPGIDKLMVVNNHILENYKRHRVQLPEDILINNVFLPPPLEDRERIIATYPPDLAMFINDHKPLLMANAFQLKVVDGVDLYGLDLCIELIKKLRAEYPQTGFVFCLANERANALLFKERCAEIKRDNLDRHFYFLTGQKEIWPLFEKVDLFVRPTYKDGYGISIDEALFFNCPAVASSACERNAEAVIFENRNAPDLYEKCIFVLNKLSLREPNQRIL